MSKTSRYVAKERWEQVAPFERWLYLLDHEHSTLAKTVPSLSRSTVTRLRGDQAGPDTISAPEGGVLPSSRAFFQQYHLVIMQQLPLVDWKELLSQPLNDVLTFRQTQLRHLRLLADIWGRLPDHLDEASGEFISFFCSCLSWQRAGTLSLETWELPLLRMNIAPLPLGAKTPVHITVLDSSQSEAFAANDLRYVQDLLSTNGWPRLVINILVGSPKATAGYRATLADNDDAILVDEFRIKTVFLNERYSEKIRGILKEDLGLRRLNPYRSEKPVVRPDMFFGREHEIELILQHPDQDFMIIGSRRIGKSSLCKRIAGLAKQDESRVAVFVDAGDVTSPDHLVQKLTEQINIRRAQDITLRNFSQMVRTNHSAKGIKYLIVIDEVDRLLEAAIRSADWRLFQILRALSQNQLSQTLFTGHRELFKQWHDLHSPLYNYATPVFLSRLDKKSTVDLIKKPLHSIGVTFNSEEKDKIVEQIVAQSGRLPSFVQFFCGALVNHLAEKHPASRVIYWEDVQAVFRLSAYRDFVLKPLGHDESNLTALEKLIVWELAHGDRTEFTYDNLVHVIEGHGLRGYTQEIVQSVKNLEIAGLITSDESDNTRSWTADQPEKVVFSVTIPALPRVLRHNHPIEREIGELVATLKDAGRG